MSEEKLVPKLRFPSYSSEWHSYTLGEILTFYSTNSFSREKLNYDTGSVKNIHYGDIHTKFPSIVSIDNNKDIPFINDDLDLSKFSEDQYLREGDLIIADASEDYEDIGKAIEVKDINNEKVLAGLHTILARDENDMAVNGFKAYLFSTNNLKTKIKIIANGISVLGISKNNLSKLNVEIPSKKEQQNIVSFISDIDKKIELLEKKHQLYLDFKNYLMQQIFAQKLRFNFDDEWKQYKLKDVLTVKSSSISINQLEENTGDYPLYGASGFLKNIDFCEMDVNYISIVKDGSGVGNLSFHEKNSSIVNTSQYLLPKKNFNINFLYYLLQTINLMKYVNGSSIPHIYFKDYCIEKINIPSLDEQEKIGKLFVDVDITMENLNKNINATQEFKKGLLQQMFV
ncbi:restriction endonuclease subunit S [Methanobrevibacter smithii]|uniref:restriction endonuclease subunit S n=1 Tax=Methanobrevibacter smithii TaxID=2173 RepID=UPI0037DD9E59